MATLTEQLIATQTCIHSQLKCCTAFERSLVYLKKERDVKISEHWHLQFMYADY